VGWAMRRIAELGAKELEWRQQGSVMMDYELVAEGEAVATLRFRSMMGSLATGQSADGCWTFKRVGFFHPKVTVRACGSGGDLGTFRNNTWSGGGSLTLRDGRKFLANTNLWATTYDFMTEGGDALIRLRSSGMMRHHSDVEILSGAGPLLAEVPWIVMLAWYLTVLMYVDAGATSAG
jgi:hypothetical protein